MMRLGTDGFNADDERRRYESTVNDLKRRYSKPRRPQPTAPGWPLPVPANDRNGQLTGSEYELVEMACTMSGRLAIANATGRSGGLPDWEATGELPSIQTFGRCAQPHPEAEAGAIAPDVGERIAVNAVLLLGALAWTFAIVTIAQWGGL